jgi:hypothetical protein
MQPQQRWLIMPDGSRWPVPEYSQAHIDQAVENYLRQTASPPVHQREDSHNQALSIESVRDILHEADLDRATARAILVKLLRKHHPGKPEESAVRQAVNRLLAPHWDSHPRPTAHQAGENVTEPRSGCHIICCFYHNETWVSSSTL